MGSKILFFFILLVINLNSFSQCKQQFVYNCAVGDAEIYLMHFNAKFDENNLEKEFSFSLKNGCEYRINLCYPTGSECKFDLYKSDSIFVSEGEYIKCLTNEKTLDLKTKKNNNIENYCIKVKATEDVKCAVVVVNYVGKAYKED